MTHIDHLRRGINARTAPERFGSMSKHANLFVGVGLSKYSVTPLACSSARLRPMPIVYPVDHLAARTEGSVNAICVSESADIELARWMGEKGTSSLIVAKQSASPAAAERELNTQGLQPKAMPLEPTRG